MRESTNIKRHPIILTALLFVLLIVVCISIQAQTKQTFKMTGAPGEIFLINELGAVISESDGQIRVDMILPPNQRDEKYIAVDIRVGDIIKMFNGKSISSVKQVEDIYSNLKVGDDVKFGIRRDRDMLIAKFVKADPEDLPAKMMVMTITDDDSPSIKTALLSAGLILKEKDGEIIVDEVISNMAEGFGETMPETGDIIIKLQGEPTEDPEVFLEIYGGVKDNEKVVLTLSRDGKEIIADFVKQPAPTATKKIIKK